MRRSCVVALLCWAALWAPAVPATSAPPEARSLTLKNGLSVLLVPDSRAGAVDVSIWYPAGVRYERPGILGISRLLERMSSRGAVPGGAEELRRRIDQEGGTTMSYTSADYTCYAHTVPRAALAMVLRWEAGRLGFRPAQAMLDQDRAAVVQENRARALAGPLELGLQRLYAAAFGSHPYRWPVTGREDDLQRITLAECERFLRDRYAPDQASVAIVGDFDPDQAIEELRSTFGAVRRHGERYAVSLEREPSGERRAVERGDSQVPLMVVGWRVPAGAAADAPALDLLSALLSRGTASRLGTTQADGGVPGLFAQTGRDARRDATMFWAASAARSAGDTTAVERWMVGEIERLASEPVSSEELDRARRRLEVGLLLGRQSAHDRGQALGQAQALTGDWNDAQRQLARLRALTPADVQEAAARTLTSTRRVVVWLTPGTSEAGEAGGRP